MKRHAERGERLGVLESGQALDEPRRPKTGVFEMPDPLAEEKNSNEDESFLRARQRVPVRRRGRSRLFSRFGWKTRWFRIALISAIVLALGLAVVGYFAGRAMLLRNPRFLLATPDSIQIAGNRVVTRAQILAAFDSDMRHSIFRIPLATRQAQIEQLRWVRRATVMRLWPDRIRVQIAERTPIGFARDGDGVQLIDGDGVLLDLPQAAAQHYSFPVLTGVSSAEPLATRAARMAQYQQFIQALDAGGQPISPTLSEVDLTDPEDVRAMFSGDGHQPLVHFGDSNFIARYQAYREHLKDWLQQYPNLQSVDMRYGRQVVLDTGSAPHSDLANSAPLADDTAARPTGVAQAGDASAPAHTAATGKAKAVSSTVKKSVAKKHTRSHETVHKHTHSKPERGHPVKNPIMHVVGER